MKGFCCSCHWNHCDGYICAASLGTANSSLSATNTTTNSLSTATNYHWSVINIISPVTGRDFMRIVWYVPRVNYVVPGHICCSVHWCQGGDHSDDWCQCCHLVRLQSGVSSEIFHLLSPTNCILGVCLIEILTKFIRTPLLPPLLPTTSRN